MIVWLPRISGKSINSACCNPPRPKHRPTDRQTDKTARTTHKNTYASVGKKKKRQELGVALVNEKVRTNGLKKKSVSRMKKH